VAYDYLPTEVRALIGVEQSPIPAAVEVQRSLIDHWIEAYEDTNPLYWDDDYAASSDFGGIVAPPGMLLTWTIPMYWTPETGPVDREAGQIHFKLKRLLGVPIGVVSNTRVEWYAPVKLGDRLSWSETVKDVTPLKTTRLGVGHFWTIDLVVRNQDGVVVGRQLWTAYAYNPHPAASERVGPVTHG
jgi:acyl dehydratase